MISICIPIYNFNVTELVTDLSRQSNLLNVPSEIILIDDGSESTFKEINKTICEKEIYIELEKNIGRSAIRNRFLDHSKYDNLLFLDCDSIIHTDDFLAKYVDALKNHPENVICGGRIYEANAPERAKRLRWKYGIVKESKSYEIRSQNPNASFMTNNFIISRSIFEAIPFDEGLREYGHEDTLFGFELKKRSVNIIHIDNTIRNGHLENNIEYIENTEKAVTNLIYILEHTNYDKDLIQDIRLLRIFYKLYKLRSIIRLAFRILKPLIKYTLSRGYVSLYLFDFYKFGILTMKMSSITK